VTRELPDLLDRVTSSEVTPARRPIGGRGGFSRRRRRETGPPVATKEACT
jgi:hypothetical protein